MRVAVLGCGPAGLMAAHAAKVCGGRVDIYSRRRKSELYGCQYLHAPIPGMTDVAPVIVRYMVHGDIDSYQAKVYGDTWDGKVSPEDLVGEHDAWDIRRTYDNLWREYGGYVHGTELSAGWLGNFMEVDARKYDIIISSVPRSVLCAGDHRFDYQSVLALGDAPERGVFVPDRLPDNTVLCNGLDIPSWYRASKVFGYATLEWPIGATLPDALVKLEPSRVGKPLSHNCDCWPELMHVGRYGRWEKGVLSHTAFQDVSALLVTEPVS